MRRHYPSQSRTTNWADDDVSSEAVSSMKKKEAPERELRVPDKGSESYASVLTHAPTHGTPVFPVRPPVSGKSTKMTQYHDSLTSDRFFSG